VWTHDLAIQVARAQSEDTMRLLIDETIEFYRAHPTDPAQLGMTVTPEGRALSALHTSVEQLSDEQQRSAWERVLARELNERFARQKQETPLWS